MTEQTIGPEDILDFWLAAGPRKWFASDPGFDAEIHRRFVPVLQQAAAGALAGWAATPRGRVALIILLDQFPRNIDRGRAAAFAHDAAALALAKEAVEQGLDRGLPDSLRYWLYMPFMHSEALADQRRSVALFAQLENAEALRHAGEHLRLIERFGRFPHRNAALGRETTAEEAAFLEEGGYRP